MNEAHLRRGISILMFFLWLITGITGFLLLVGPLLVGSGISIPPFFSVTLHTYLSFAFFGVSVIHLSLNWNAFKSYFKRNKKREKEGDGN